MGLKIETETYACMAEAVAEYVKRRDLRAHPKNQQSVNSST